jgi:NTE family protein
MTDNSAASRGAGDRIMGRALVLGGGGPLGIAWECGLLTGLAESGIALGEADFVLGTSAGSVAGATQALGADLQEIVELSKLPLPLPTGARAPDLDSLQAAMGAAAAGATTPDDALIAIGSAAATSPTVSESDFIGRPTFATLHDRQWPEAFRCTGIDIETAELVMWDANSGVALDRATAASCSVPTMFPVVEVDGRRYMDGGMRDALNAGLATGYGLVVAVSCWALELPDGVQDPTFELRKAGTDADFAALRAGGATVHVIPPGPSYLDVSGWGQNIMDVALVPDAYQAGREQAAAECDRLRDVWMSVAAASFPRSASTEKTSSCP